MSKDGFITLRVDTSSDRLPRLGSHLRSGFLSSTGAERNAVKGDLIALVVHDDLSAVAAFPVGLFDLGSLVLHRARDAWVLLIRRYETVGLPDRVRDGPSLLVGKGRVAEGVVLLLFDVDSLDPALPTVLRDFSFDVLQHRLGSHDGLRVVARLANKAIQLGTLLLLDAVLILHIRTVYEGSDVLLGRGLDFDVRQSARLNSLLIAVPLISALHLLLLRLNHRRQGLFDATQSVKNIHWLSFDDPPLLKLVLRLTIGRAIPLLHAQEVTDPDILLRLVEEVRAPPIVIHDVLLCSLFLRAGSWQLVVVVDTQGGERRLAVGGGDRTYLILYLDVRFGQFHLLRVQGSQHSIRKFTSMWIDFKALSFVRIVKPLVLSLTLSQQLLNI